jgi:release factor glutamine methyltransferase
LPEAVQETALDLAAKAARHLAERGVENARLEAELMLAAILGLNRLSLYLQYDRPIDGAELEQFRASVRRRLKREPLQYILGRAGFRRLELQVDARVLVPRPETEVLVDHVLAWLGTSTTGEAGKGGAKEEAPGRTSGTEDGGSGEAPVLVVLDVGTGSGAIALSVAQESAARVVATDVSADALDVARANAARLGLADRIDFREGPLWQATGANEVFSVIVSNPPYIAETERASLPPEVRDWEPASALYGGADGLAVIRELIRGAAAHLEPAGLLALEVGADQAARVTELLREQGGYHNIRTEKDLAGHERVVLAEFRDR